MNVKEIMPGLTQIDLQIPEAGFRKFITSWLIRDETRGQTLLVETGPASAVGALLRDLAALDVKTIDYVLYTHIHLDHSGGVGAFHRAFPDAKVVAPHKGRPHLVDPSTLWNASLSNLGEPIVAMYGEPEPLPESALAPEDAQIDGLSLIHTPGHAPHHDAYIYDLDGTRLLFVGEAAGYSEKLADGSYYMRPATPHKFFYETALESLDRLLAAGHFDLVCYPHRGCSADVDTLLHAARKQMVLWLDILSALPPNTPVETCVEALRAKDPLLVKIDQLAEEDRRREEIFVRNSIKGYKGYLERRAKDEH